MKPVFKNQRAYSSNKKSTFASFDIIIGDAMELYNL